MFFLNVWSLNQNCLACSSQSHTTPTLAHRLIRVSAAFIALPSYVRFLESDCLMINMPEIAVFL